MYDNSTSRAAPPNDLMSAHVNAMLSSIKWFGLCFADGIVCDCYMPASGHHTYSYHTPENGIIVNVLACMSVVVSVDTVSNAFRLLA